MKTIPDAEQRQRALDVTQSFIVQAPAGSGKTALLTQRILALLATVDDPEQVLAITFTKKAAGEMRHRLLQALTTCFEDKSNSPYEIQTAKLAQAVLVRSETRGWSLLENPNRLRLLTIDAFSAMLVKQMPLLSRMGSGININPNAERLYEIAATRFLDSIEIESNVQPALATLFLHVENQYQTLKRLFIEMLQFREHWLPLVLHSKQEKDLRYYLENNLQEIIFECIQKIKTTFGKDFITTLQPLIQFSLSQLESDHELQILASLDIETQTREPWIALSKWLQTEKGEWRKRLDKNGGFPAAASASDKIEKQQFQSMKNAMEAILSDLRDDEMAAAVLYEIRDTPQANYSEAQWDVINALLICLPRLAAELQLLFTETQTVDFIQVAQGANFALGDIDSPHDLALKLDYQIKHILIDEFQDTSLGQFQLLTKLTAGWTPNDGRTLFCVGDPMQSIYRFRQAEVGLFLQAQRHGIGSISLEPLFLSANFRSEASIVNWLNIHFSKILPAKADPLRGAVTFHEAISIHDNDQGGVFTHPTQQTAATMMTLIKSALENAMHKSIAVLVRSKSHIVEMLPALRAENIAFQAVEMENLASQPVIQDLLCLIRALNHEADSIAWLALLRAPWCGLSLADLLILTEQHAASIPHCLANVNFSLLSQDGKNRLEKIAPLLLNAFEQRETHPDIAEFIRQRWFALGGPACYENPLALQDAETFFTLISAYSHAGQIDMKALEQGLATLFANQSESARLQIMTMHKAKGLEFDVVILPHLHKRPRNQQVPILQWMERPTSASHIGFILAPIKEKSLEHCDIQHYIQLENDRKNRYESARLLYVAITRAKKICHLVYEVEKNESGFSAPVKQSLLSHLWPHLSQDFEIKIVNEITEIDIPLRAITRVADKWQSPVIDDLPTLHNKIEPDDLILPDEEARLLGTLLHRIIKSIADNKNAFDNPAQWINANYHHALSHIGIKKSALAASSEILKSALINLFEDEKAAFILSPHDEAQSELALSTTLFGEIQHLIIDRTFIFKGTRYIYDYKFIIKQIDNPADFLAEQRKRYLDKLMTYAKLFIADQRPIKLGLYFPLQKLADEWNFLRLS